MSFKPISMSDSATYVSFYDPAVDREKIIDRELNDNEELKSRFDLSDEQKRSLAWDLFELRFAGEVAKQPGKSVDLLILKDGETPTKFIIGAIPPDEVNRIHDDTFQTPYHRGKFDERFFRAFLHGIRNIENWPTEVKKRNIGDLQYVDPDWAKKTFIRGLRRVAINVGQVALAWQELTEEDIVNLS